MLQAYSLSRVVRDLGYDVVVDVSTRPSPSRAPLRAMKAIRTRFARNPVLRSEVFEAMSRDIARFVRDETPGERLFGLSTRPRRDVMRRTDGFIVGSDQVWRAEYGDLGSYLLDFVPASSPALRVAYAASFGKRPSPDDHRYTRLRAHANAFDAIAVREHSAIRACRDTWGVDATWAIDPVALHTASAYRSLLGIEQEDPIHPPSVYSYLLDPSREKLRALESIRRDQGLSVVANHSIAVPSFAEFRVDRSRYLRSSVKAWVRGIANANVVHTDSFHGLLLALLFNRPFVLHPNAERGVDRFQTLLAVLELPSQLLESAGDHFSLTTPNWSKINELFEAHWLRGIGYLEDALRGTGLPRINGLNDS